METCRTREAEQDFTESLRGAVKGKEEVVKVLYKEVVSQEGTFLKTLHSINLINLLFISSYLYY